MKSFARILLILVLAAAGAHAYASDKKNKSTPSPSPGASAVPGASPTPTPRKFDPPIPPGHPAEGVKLPYYDAVGRLQMFFNIAKAFRVDIDHMQLKNAYMQTYDEKGVPDANVFMTLSMLDLNTRIVTSDVPVSVRRSDFEITGQKMVFNTQTRVGHMSGHVHMVIYNKSEMSVATPSPSPAAKDASRPASSPGASAPSASPQAIN